MAYERLVAALLLTIGLSLGGCPVTSVVGKNGGQTQETRDLDPGPPEVLNPSLLDRG